MSIIGTFDPVTEDYPSGSVTGSINLVADSNFELGAGTPLTAYNDYDVAYNTAQAYTGSGAYRLTVDSTNSGFGAAVSVLLDSTSGMQANGVRFSYRLYLPTGSPFIGGRIIEAWTSNPSHTYIAGRGSAVLVEGWNYITDFFSASDVVSSTVAGQFRLDLAYLYPTIPSPGSTYGFVSGNDGAQMWIDEVLVKEGTSTTDWEPANGEPFFTNGQQWVASVGGTFQGLSLGVGDILTCTNDVGYWGVAADSSWEVTNVIATVEEALQSKPTASHGFPIGLGDWKLAVQILLPTDATSRWGIATWGESQWNGLGWYDLSNWVRGLEWTRGTTEFAGRPEVGVASITLDNDDRQFSPWNGISSFQNSTVLTDTGAVLPGYMAPGTVVRVVAFSPSGMIQPITDPDYLDPDSDDSWVPQFTGVVESWVDDTVGLGADSYVTVTLVETMAQLAKIDENALGSPVGNNDEPYARFARLVDLSGWEYGIVPGDYSYDVSLVASDYYLQSTDLASNRISEFYLTADSSLATVRTDRSGALTYYNAVEHGGPGFGILRGPDKGAVSGFSYEGSYDEGFGIIYSPYVGDSARIANDDEPIINKIDYAYAGAFTVNSDQDNVSIAQYGKRAISRYDFITKSNDLLLLKIEKQLDGRARTPLRLSEVSLHSAMPYALLSIIGLDIDNGITVFLAPLDGSEILAGGHTIGGMTHKVTPLNGSEITWTVDITLNSAGGAFFENY